MNVRKMFIGIALVGLTVPPASAFRKPDAAAQKPGAVSLDMIGTPPTPKHHHTLTFHAANIPGSPQASGWQTTILQFLKNNPSLLGLDRTPDLRVDYITMIHGQQGLSDRVYVNLVQTFHGVDVAGTAVTFSFKPSTGDLDLQDLHAQLHPDLLTASGGPSDLQISRGRIEKRAGSSRVRALNSKVRWLQGRWRTVHEFSIEDRGLHGAVDGSGQTYIWDDRLYATYSGSASGRQIDFDPYTTGSNLTTTGLSYLQLSDGLGASTFADISGAYSLTTNSSSNLTVGLAGKWAKVIDTLGANLTTQIVAGSPNPVNLLFNPTGNIDTQTAQVNAYRHPTLEHDWINARGVNPTGLDISLPVNVNINSTCNAYYGGSSLNFYAAGGGCINTAFDTIIYHEYGHFIDDMIGGITDGGLSEGWGDIMGTYITGQPLLGENWQGPGSFVRNANNNYIYHAGDEVHTLGQAWMGFAWDLRTNLINSLGPTAGAALAENLVIPVFWANSPDIPSAVRAVAMRDDDDGNLANGTPHFAAIQAAAAHHGLSFVFDFTPPTAPTNPQISNPTPLQLTLSWTAATDNVAVTGYRIDVSTTSTFTPLLTSYANRDVSNVTSFPISGLNPSTTYYAQVRAYDASANISSNSVTAQGVTLAQDSIPPVVVISTPATGSILSNLVTLSGTASDNISVSAVTIYVDGTQVGIATGTVSWTYALFTRTFPNGAHTLTVHATDSSNNIGTAFISATFSNTGAVATYSALKVPQCTGSINSCDSGTLLNGRGIITGGPEVNQPNTLQSSCADGPSGTYHTDESIDNVRVYTLDNQPFAPGKTVRVEATVWAFNATGSDTLDIFYTADTNTPVWTYVGSVIPPATGLQVLSATYVLPGGNSQAVRANFRYGGSAIPCTTGTFDDHDDLAFQVATSTDTTAPTAPLTVSFSSPTSNSLSLSWSPSTDNVAVTGYRIDVSTMSTFTPLLTSYANRDVSNVTSFPISGLNASTTYYAQVRAYDAAANISSNSVTAQGITTPADTIPPVVSITTPTAGSILSNLVTISGMASDNVGISTISIWLDGTKAGSASGTAPWTYSLDTRAFSNGAHNIIAQALDAAGNQATAILPVTLANIGGTAIYSSVLKAPQCTGVINLCDSVTLLNGRASIVNGAETNQPNTLQSSCLDGTAGNYHADESIDKVRVYTLDNQPFAPGKIVKIEATVWAYTAAGADVLDFYYTASASSPSWTYVTSLIPPAAGLQVLSSTYTLPVGTLQALRANFRYGGTAIPCTTGSYDDHDDLAFQVGAGDTAPPTVPLNVAFSTPTLSSLQLSWTPSTDNVGVTGYRVDLSTGVSFSTFVSSYNNKDVGNVTGVFLSALNLNTTYYARVRAYDAAQNVSSSSLVAQGQTLPDTTPPTAPLNVSLSSPTGTGLTLIWTASSDNVGVAGYRVDLSTDSLFNVYAFGYKNYDFGPSASITFAGLNSSTTYYARMRAYDAAQNISPDSAIAQGTTLSSSTIPVPPTNVTISSPTSTTVLISWTASISSGVTGNIVYLSTTPILYPYQALNVGNVSQTTATGLLPGTTYFAGVVTLVGNTASPMSAIAQGSTLPPDTTPPTPPISVIFSSPTMTTLRLSWSGATDNNQVVNYYVDVSSSSVFNSFVGSYHNYSPPPASPTQISILGLQPGTSYYARVRSVDAAFNVSSYSVTALGLTLTDTVPPTAPGNVLYSNPTSSSLQLSWSPSTDNVGVIGYQAEISSQTPFNSFITYQTAVTTGVTISNLASGTTYYARMRAFDMALNFSSYSLIAQSVTLPAPLPPPPTISISLPFVSTAVFGIQELDAYVTNSSPVSHVDYFIDGQLQSTTTTYPYSGFWDTTAIANGPHSVSAIIYDTTGQSGISNTLNLTVSNLIVFQDNLSGNLNAWTVVDDGNISAPSAWAIAGGVLTQTSPIYGNDPNNFLTQPGTQLFTGTPAWTDYSFTSQIRPGNGSIGVIFRYKDNNNYYRFSMDPDGYRRFIQKTNGVVSLQSQDFVAYTPGQWVTVTVNVKSYWLQIFINGQLAMTSLNSSTGQGGVGFYTWKTTDASFRNVKVLSSQLPPALAPVITSSTTATGTAGTVFNYQISATNNPTSFNAAGLPAGLIISTTTGLLSGIPTSVGTSSITLSATNAGGTGTAVLVLTILPPPDTTPPTVPANVSFSSPTLSSLVLLWSPSTDTVGVAGYKVDVSSDNSFTSILNGYNNVDIPAGNPGLLVTGLMAGTTVYARVRAYDAALNYSNYSLTVAGMTLAPDTTPPTAPTNVVASSPTTTSLTFSWTAGTDDRAVVGQFLQLTNDPTFQTYSNFTLGTSTTITFSPLTSGTSYYVHVRAFDAAGNNSPFSAVGSGQTLPLPPVITSSATASGQVGVSYAYQITATNNPTSFNAVGLPAGLSISAMTGLVSGTPASVGTSSITLSASNSGGTGTAAFTLTVLPSSPVITSPLIVTTVIGSTFSYQITATNNPTSFDAPGFMPPGITISTTTGVLSGIPTVAGWNNVPIRAFNSGGMGVAILQIHVLPLPPVITSSSTAVGQIGVAFSYAITATNQPYVFSATGLPPGVMVDSMTGILSGIPLSSGTSNVLLSASNDGGTGTATLTITVLPSPPVITSASSATGTAGTPFNYQITATNSPTSFNAVGLPAGLAINTTNGLLSGTPSTVGTSSITLSATNAGGTGTALLLLTVNAALPQPPVITSAASATGTVGSSFTYTITATNNPTSFNAVGLPSGLSINTLSGSISGVPGFVGTSTVTLSASNAGGTGTASLVLTILPAPDTTPPSIPANVSFTTPGQNSLTLSWSASSDNVAVAGYRVDVSLDNAFGVLLATFTNRDVGNVTTILASGLTPATTYFARVRAYDTNQNVSSNSGVASGTTLTPVSSTATATYSSTLKAPQCSGSASTCDSGPSLLNGRANIKGGHELNQPNTINNSCADGTAGIYHSDESVDRIRVYTVDGTPLVGGKMVRIEVTLYAYSGYSSDALDVYYASNASSPAWTFIATIVPTGAGIRTLVATYTLPTGTTPQAVRANFRYVGSRSACSTGSYDDHDDLIFQVGSALGGSVTNPPSTSLIQGDMGIPSSIPSIDYRVGINVSAQTLNDVRVYPNPWRSDRSTKSFITFDQMTAGSTVKIFTIAGQWVQTLAADSNGSAQWNRTNSSGDNVASGVYLYLITDSQGGKTRGELAIIH